MFMIKKQMQTRRVTEPQVNFYRTIAFSFFVITIFLLGVIVFFTSKKAEIVVIAKESVKNINFAINVEENCDTDKCITGSVTSMVFVWTEKYFPTGTKIKLGIAEGKITIYNKSGSSQALVKTTRFTTKDGVLFRLKENITVPANGEIIADVYADQPGGLSDIEPSDFTIPGLSLDKQKLIYGKSSEPMKGGSVKVGILSEDDLSSAKKDFQEKTTKAFITNNPEIDLPNRREIISVSKEEMSPSNKAGEEVSEFTITGTSEITVVSFTEDEIMELIEKEAGKKIDFTLEKLVSAKKEPTITISSMDLTNKKAELLVVQEATVTLDANAEKLSAQNFAGKKKDEIERYVMGLNYVSGVEVKFSPSWMRTAPTVMDKIKVVVKNVQ